MQGTCRLIGHVAGETSGLVLESYERATEKENERV